MEWFKKYWWVIIIGLLILPLLINACYLLESDCSILHTPSAWATFWATYLAAIASFAMVLATWWTLKQNSKQHQDTLQHWEDEIRPYIEVRIVKYFFPHQVCLEFYNFGETTAKDITFSFKPSFLAKINNKTVKKALSEMGNYPFYLYGGSTKLIPIALEDNVSGVKVYMIGNHSVSEQVFGDALIDFMRVQTFEVCGKYGSKYTFDEIIPYANFDGERRTIEASLENITKTLSNIAEKTKPTNNVSLEKIAQSISSLSSIIETTKPSTISLEKIDKTLSDLLETIRSIKALELKKQRNITRRCKLTKTDK